MSIWQGIITLTTTTYLKYQAVEIQSNLREAHDVHLKLL